MSTFDAVVAEACAAQPSIEEIRAEEQAAMGEAPGALNAAPVSVSFPGTIGSALGGADWAPEDAAVAATDAGDGTWTLTATLPAGSCEFKPAINNSWNENYGAGGVVGGDNIPLTLDAETEVTFVYERATNAVFALSAGDEVIAGERPE